MPRGRCHAPHVTRVSLFATCQEGRTGDAGQTFQQAALVGVSKKTVLSTETTGTVGQVKQASYLFGLYCDRDRHPLADADVGDHNVHFAVIDGLGFYLVTIAS